MNSRVVYLRFFCIFLLGMMSLSGIGMHRYSKIPPSEFLNSPNGLSSSDTLAPSPSSVNVTFIYPVQRNPLQHYLFPPKFEVAIENSSIITWYTIGLRSNETGLGSARIYFSVELEGVITSRIWKESENGVLQMIVEAKTAEHTATDSVWIIKDTFEDFLSRNWIFILIGTVLVISVPIITNRLMNKRIASKSKIPKNST
jgi:hypothetical protein